jgi:transglutaminase-like putative cysteine protease
MKMFSKIRPKNKNEYLFLFGVGGAYLFAVNRTIISATLIQITPLRLYFMGLFLMLLFTVMLFNRVTRIASLSLLILAAVVLLFRREATEEIFNHFNDVFFMATGYLSHNPQLLRTLMWLIVSALSFTTVVFMLYRFSFYLLALGGGLIFALSWFSSFIRDTLSFLVFLFAFILIFIRKMNKSIDTVALAAPLCLAVILLVHGNLPAQSDAYIRRSVRDAFEGRFIAIEDFFFELFNPMYFSFATTGFSGTGGRLGGPVTPNDHPVMEVAAPGMLYLSGATHNRFTGQSWVNTLQEGDIYTHNLSHGHFEMLETAAALMRSAGLARGLSNLNIAALRSAYLTDNLHDLNPQDFAVAGVWAEETFSPYGFGISHEEFEELLQELALFHMPLGGWAINSFGYDEVFIQWLLDWIMINPQYGDTPSPDLLGRVRYFWHVYLPIESVSVYIGRNRTGTVFRPPNARELWFDPGSSDYLSVIQSTPSGDLRAPAFMSRNTVYHHQFLHVNPQLSFVRDILYESRAGLYASRGQATSFVTPHILNEVFDVFTRHGVGTPQAFECLGGSRRDFAVVLDAFSTDTLAAHAESIRTHFLYVPESVPQRVHDLTAYIIRNEATDFGRVTAIRDFLLANFPYTLDTVPVPRNVCFVDFFLFEGQEGYCTYFASAMAIMSRIAGVPSRYVEGFFVPGAGRHIYGFSSVTNRMAHAWADVYLEGFGWLTMEATPSAAFVSDFYEPLRQDALGGLRSYWDDPARMDMDDWLLYAEFNGDASQGIPRTANAPHETEATGIGTHRIIIFSALILCAILGGIFLFLLVCRIRFYFALARISRLNFNRQAQIYFKAILTISEYYHLSMHPGETTLAYSKRAGKRFAFRSDSIFLRDLIALYNRAKYGKNLITAAELKLMKDSYFDMLALLQAMRKKPHYLYLRHIKKIGAV